MVMSMRVKKSIIGSVALTLSIIMPYNLDSSDFDPIGMLKKARENFAAVNDYTATFIKQQRIKGKLNKKETIFTKFKKPFCIYYKWVQPDGGKEVIYVEGKNKGKLIAHLGGAAMFFPIAKWLNPEDPMAMEGNKYPITRSGIGNMIESLISQYELAQSADDLEVFYMGIESLDGRPTHVIARRLPKKDDYACYLSMTNIDIATKLPIRNISYDWDHTLSDLYYYKDLKLNQGLTDKDFDPNNRKYKFGLFKF